jgi:hypothetical protein
MKKRKRQAGDFEDQKRIAYNHFLTRAKFDDLRPGWKDSFLCDRVEYDALQKDLNLRGHNMCHDEIKDLILKMDKAGYLGGISTLESYDERNALVEQRKTNFIEFGNPGGVESIIEETELWASKANSPLNDYYQTQGWQARSWEFRKAKNWTCELCLADHSKTKHLLHTHHRTYKLIDGSCALYCETERELMALCASPCHQMADIARMVREGKHEWRVAETMNLF